MRIKTLVSDNLFLHPNQATKEGIVAFGGDLSPKRLMEAYRRGIFPWYSEGDPIVWWSPDPRLILEFDDFILRRSLKKRMKLFNYKFDESFLEVIMNCAKLPRKNQEGTWINQDVIEAYTILYNMGIAHSVEAYQNDKLVGGAYGVIVGSVFCGESMFTIVNDASKAAFAILVEHLKVWGYSFIDCQIPTSHLKSLGAKEISRDIFLKKLKINSDRCPYHNWKLIAS